MKKYSIFKLYIVEIENDSNIQYLICKHTELSDIYVEIFTNQKIKITDILNIEPLSNYYSVLAQFNCKTGKPLMLDKKELLIKYITVNNLKKENEIKKLQIRDI